MGYTNGYEIVQTALAGRLGWSGDNSLSDALKASASGRYFDDGSFHALVTLENIKSTAKAQTDWNAWLTAKQKAVSMRALNAVFNKPEFVEQVILHERVTEQEYSQVNQGKAVVHRIKVARSLQHAVRINSLTVYFDSDVTFNAYLYKQGSNTPVKTIAINALAGVRTEIPLDECILTYRESPVYYLVYFQDELGAAQAIQEDVCYNPSKLFGVMPALADVEDGVFDRDELSFTVNRPYGINMLVTSFRDFTQDVVNQPYLFDELQGLQMAYQVIEDIIYSVRSNTNERITKDALQSMGIMLDLNGVAPVSDSPRVVGLKQRIEREVIRVKQAFYPEPKAQTVNLSKC